MGIRYRRGLCVGRNLSRDDARSGSHVRTAAVVAVALLACGVASARPVMDNDEAQQITQSCEPVKIGPWTFDCFGRHSRLQLPDGRSVDVLYDGDTDTVVGYRKNNGAFELPRALPSCQLSDASAWDYCLAKHYKPKELREEEEEGGHGGTGYGGTGAGGYGGTGTGSGSSTGNTADSGFKWTDPQCSTRCDIALNWALVGCGMVALLDAPLGAVCAVAETSAWTYCVLSCRP